MWDSQRLWHGSFFTTCHVATTAQMCILRKQAFLWVPISMCTEQCCNQVSSSKHFVRWWHDALWTLPQLSTAIFWFSWSSLVNTDVLLSSVLVFILIVSLCQSALCNLASHVSNSTLLTTNIKLEKSEMIISNSKVGFQTLVFSRCAGHTGLCCHLSVCSPRCAQQFKRLQVFGCDALFST